MRIVILGLGYSASAFLNHVKGKFTHVTATVRSTARADALAGQAGMLTFDGSHASDALQGAIKDCDTLLVSIPPDDMGDPVLRCLRQAIERAEHLRWIGYLSTVGVYGDHQGAWVDEATPCRPVSARSVSRLEAEEDWLSLAENGQRNVQLFRLSGIYGPGRNALVNMRDGMARRIDKPGQVFNRIHVADIAGAVAAAMHTCLDGGIAPPILNITDHEPCPPQDVVAHAALLMGVEPPPLVPFAEAELSQMGRSFYGENKRVSNLLVRESLGFGFRFPSYREGLASLWNDMKAGPPAQPHP